MKFGFLRRRLKQFGKELTVISGLNILSSIAALSIPWFASQVLSGLFQSSDVDMTQMALLLVGVLFVLTITNITSSIVSGAASLRILNQLRLEVYRHAQLTPMRYHNEHQSGDTLALMTSEVNRLSTFLTATLAGAPSMFLTAVGAVIALFLIDPMMALAIPIVVPLFYIVLKLLGRRLAQIGQKVRQAEVRLISIAKSDLSMLPAIKAFADEEVYDRRYNHATEDARALKLTQTKLMAIMGPSVALIASLAAIGVLLIGNNQLASGELSPGELLAFLLYAALLTRPVGSLANLYGQLQVARGALQRLESFLGTEIEPGYGKGQELNRAAGAITITELNFAYPRRAQVLDGLNLSIKPGEIVALTGPNGEGKSTLVQLLLRFYEPQSGSIELDGTNIADLQVQDLRRQFGYVPQRALLFNGTVAENIAFGEAIDGQSVEQALAEPSRLAQADAFIAELPNGYDTVIGDHGIRLSGGQRQRIALARALYRDPPIMILDEATSMYDLESEAAFVEDCVRSLKGKTIILITHRPASLVLADRILEVAGGKVRETNHPHANMTVSEQA
jgi:ATP-binding cassette subfamily B protein/subfamily B ATP-binding cassette protein MsbA